MSTLCETVALAGHRCPGTTVTASKPCSHAHALWLPAAACRFVFECLSGVRQEGVMGAVLADGMGEQDAEAARCCGRQMWRDPC